MRLMQQADKRKNLIKTGKYHQFNGIMEWLA